MEYFTNPYIFISTKEYNLHNLKKLDKLFCYSNCCFFNELIIINNILFYGYIIDPFNPKKTNKTIIEQLDEIKYNEHDFFKVMSKYSGRYIIIKDNICFTDTCGQMQIFYYIMNDNFIITSSQKLISIAEPEYKINTLLEKINISKKMKFYGHEGVIKNSYIILPNHYLNINNMKLTRYSRLYYILSKEPNIQLLCDILEGSFEAIVFRYGNHLHLGITGGYDTRLLLGFVEKYKNKFNFFHALYGNNIDFIIAKELSNNLDIKLDIVNFKKDIVNDNFIELYNNNKLLPYYSYKRVKSDIIYYMFKNHKNCMLITGTCAGIYRNYYGSNDITCFSQFIKKLNFKPTTIHKELLKEYYLLNDYAEKNNISILDLFYWEQRLGFWNGSNADAYNIIGNIFVPFNNRIYITEMLKFNKNDINYCKHYEKILHKINKQYLLNIKINCSWR
jgi:hypothetical protein